ncbi:hypothetical protein PUN28_002554 [Cardiocondyla obscurior]|uniref:Uncharacterized protein n=1 Tax=Cardiocondyla obscurior TaxID=286306 RepID=A0AAW2GUQ5_9HYME
MCNVRAQMSSDASLCRLRSEAWKHCVEYLRIFNENYKQKYSIDANTLFTYEKSFFRARVLFLLLKTSRVNVWNGSDPFKV